jgi:hypothetical protein
MIRLRLPLEEAKRCAAFILDRLGARDRVSLVAYDSTGLGCHFNEPLMLEMTRAGRGNSYCGQTAQDLMDAFVEELDLLAALCARNVRLRLATAPGVRATVLNDYRCCRTARCGCRTSRTHAAPLASEYPRHLVQFSGIWPCSGC